MNWGYLITGILFSGIGILILYAFSKQLIKEIRIRSGGRKYDGIILKSAYLFHYRLSSSYRPVIMVKALRKQLVAIKAITFLKPFQSLESYNGKHISIIYHSNYPNECTFGTKVSVVIDTIIFMFFTIFSLAVGLYGLINCF